MKEEVPKKIQAGKVIIQGMKDAGINFVSALPDSWLTSCLEEVRNDSAFTYVRVVNESQGIAVCAGAWLGGKKPAVLHQNTGLFESGDSLRGLGLGFPLPLLLLIGYRGWRREAPVTDSAAIFTEPVINAWGIRHYFVETDADLGSISLADREAQQTNRPVAAIFRREYQRT